MTKDIVYCRTAETAEDAVYLIDRKRIRPLRVLTGEKPRLGTPTPGDAVHSAGPQLTSVLVRAVTDQHE